VNTKNCGKLGEEIAKNYLIEKGYKILDRNFVFKIARFGKRGEIDIVAKKKDVICFVEVKSINKKKKFFIFPEAKVNSEKKKRLIQSAEGWLIKNKFPLNCKWQIDIISIIFENKKFKIYHFENAIS